MKTNRGCVNPDCECFSDKKHFDEREKCCSVCGSVLVTVCKVCYKPIVDGKKRCIRCEAMKVDKGDKAMDTAKTIVKVAIAAVQVAGAINEINNKINAPTDID